MLQIDGIPPRLNSQACEEFICQQYRYRGRLQQEVDVLLLKVNGRWHQLYFENGTVYWRLQGEAPKVRAAQPDDPLSHPLVDLGENYKLKECVIADCITEPLLDGARISFVFEHKGTLVVSHSNNNTSLRFINAV